MKHLWKTLTLADVGMIVSGGTPSTKEKSYWNGDIPWITPADLSGYNHKFIAHGAKFITKDGLQKSSARLMPGGSVLFSSRAPIGYVAIAKNPVCTNQGFKSIVPNLDIIDPEYLYYYLKNSKHLADELASGTTFKEISSKAFSKITIPVPCLSEQKSIVKKIESLLQEVEIGRNLLNELGVKLNIYNQSTLNAAIRGKLIPQDSNDEHVSVFLESIKEKKEALINSGKLKKEKYVLPINPYDMPYELPTGWVWVRLEALLYSIQAGKSFKCEERPPADDEVGVVKVSAVTWGEYDETQTKTCTNRDMINPQYFIQEGDFLFSRANTIELVGAVVIVKDVNLKIMLSDKILRFHFVDDSVKFWVLLCLRSKYGRSEIQNKSTGNQDSMRNIGQVAIKNIVIPIPPKREREEIMRKVKFTNDEHCLISGTLTKLLDLSAVLKKSILKNAFEGKLK